MHPWCIQLRGTHCLHCTFIPHTLVQSHIDQWACRTQPTSRGGHPAQESTAREWKFFLNCKTKNEPKRKKGEKKRGKKRKKGQWIFLNNKINNNKKQHKQSENLCLTDLFGGIFLFKLKEKKKEKIPESEILNKTSKRQFTHAVKMMIKLMFSA